MNHPSTSSGSLNHTIVPISPPPTAPPPNLPRLDLLDGSRKNYVKYAVPLYQASVKGNWKAAKAILDEKPELIRFAITETCETMLHIAASAKSTKSVENFVENLVTLMDNNDLELQNSDYYTALTLAASVGNVKTSMIMLNKNKALMDVPFSYNKLPLYMAAAYAKPDMTRYLYDNSRKMTGHFWTHENRSQVLQKCIEADIFDVALKILNDRNELIANKEVLTGILLALAQKTRTLKELKHLTGRIFKSMFNVKAGHAENENEALLILRIVWSHVAIMPKSEIDNILQGPLLSKENVREYPSQVLFVAANSGNTRFIIELIRSYPELLWKQNEEGRTIFHIAVKCRNAEIYNLLYEIGSMKDRITRVRDYKGNNLLHLVAKCSNLKRFQNVSGVALQMQRELLWFKEVEQMIPNGFAQQVNNSGYTPHELFPRRHQDLVTKGEEWMKNTASQCMVVATLIATIVFAAAFALPGGYNQDTGIPFFRQKPSLVVFVISDAVSLISSSTSVLMFLSILTSRYAQRDFLQSLPNKLMFGLATLFLSIVTMMVAFSSSFFVLYNKDLQWMPIIVTSLAGIPVILYAILQIRLLGDVFFSTYQSRYLFKPKKAMLY